MKRLTLLFLIVLLLAAVGIFATPLGPVPGFFIGGESKPAPVPWPDTADIDEVRLRVPGTLPRVVVIWVVAYDGDLHVVGAADSGWVGRLGPGGPVQLRLQNSTYDLEAQRIDTGWEPILNAYVEKYRADYPEIVEGFPSLEEAEGQFALYRLERPE